MKEAGMVGVMPCLLLILFLEPRAVAAAYSEYSCNGTTGNYTASDAFGANLARLTAELPINASTSPSLYASAAIGTSSDKVSALALCRGDITDASTCSGCLDNAFQQLRALCAGERDATFYHDLCTLRYSGEDFLGRPEDNSPVINAMDVNRSTFAAWDSGNATSRSFFLSLVGTLFGEMAIGYMAPEYASEGLFSVKSDVFSFGVLLLEIVSGKRNSSGHGQHYGEFVNLLSYAWQLWRDGRALELVDPSLGQCNEQVADMMRCVKVALLCVQDNAMDRPTMSDVTAMLGHDEVPLPEPRWPPHFHLRVTSDDEEDRVGRSGTRSTHFTGSCSTNDMTISTIQEGR
uniref:Gnk2-homologous domain-containing protein n=1 Tax=Triticum aestivum TaxID=4565 RepID=A0A077S7E6_WHEAT|nr:unnamed protein product [Triticum aestivum]